MEAYEASDNRLLEVLLQSLHVALLCQLGGLNEVVFC